MYYRIFDIHPKSCEYKIILTLVAKILKPEFKEEPSQFSSLPKDAGFRRRFFLGLTPSQLPVRMVRHTIVGWKSYISVASAADY